MLTRFKIAFLKWQIQLLLKNYHLARNGSGRKKKEKPIEADYKMLNRIAEEMGHESPLGDEISADYRKSHLLGKFPGKSMGD